MRLAATLMLTGAKDPRVSPWHGQGTAMSERIAELADIQAFFLWQIAARTPGVSAPR